MKKTVVVILCACACLALLWVYGIRNSRENKQDTDRAYSAEVALAATSGRSASSSNDTPPGRGFVVPTPNPAGARKAGDTASPGDLVALVRNMGDVDDAVRRMDALATKGRGDEDALVAALLPGDGEDVILFVCECLADIGTGKAVSRLFELLDGLPENSDIRRAVGEMIVSVANTECRQVLIDTMMAAMNSESSGIAQRALANMAGEEVIVSLMSGYAGAESAAEKEMFADTIRHMRDPVVVPLLMSLVESDRPGPPDVLDAAACATLGVIGSREATAFLLARLGGPLSPNEAAASSRAVAGISNPDSCDVLLDAARDEKDGTGRRLAAIRALKNQDYDRVEKTLERIVVSAQDETIREAARAALDGARKHRSR